MDRHNLTAADLDALPVGAVVLDSGHPEVAPDERCAWQKSDDTHLQDEYGDRLKDAWGSIQWAVDKTGAALAEGHSPIRLLWHPAEADHRLDGASCTCGVWVARLGESVARSFDRHLLDVR